MKRKILIIVNPVSGRKEGIRFEQMARDMLDEAGISYVVKRTSFAGQTTAIASTSGNAFTDIIAIGGDGTLNEVLNGMKDRRTVLGVIPAGTGNDFLKTLGDPGGIRESVKSALFGKPRIIDSGECNGIRFINGVGIGFDGLVVDDMRKQACPVLPVKMRYMSTVFRLLLGYREARMSVLIDGRKRHEELFMVTVGNGSTFGGGYKLCPDAKLDDGWFDVCLIHRLSIIRRFLKVPLTYSGKHIVLPEVEIIRCRELDITSESPIPGHVDGNFAGYGPYHIRLLPSSVSIRTVVLYEDLTLRHRS